MKQLKEQSCRLSHDPVLTLKPVKMGPWRPYHYCTECGAQLDERTRMYSGAICPACGHKSIHASTICDTYVMAERKVYTFVPKWWQFWRRSKYTIERKRV